MKENMRMSLVLLSVVTLLAAQPVTGTCQSGISGQINFVRKPWQEVLKMAKEQNKLIFVDAYASWCGPCMELKATTFKDKAVGAYFNKHFINFSIDIEKGEGVRLAAQWNLESYPSLYIFDSRGHLISSNQGFVDEKELLRFAQSAR